MDNFHKSNFLHIKQPFGDFYIISIPAKKLVDICYSFPAVYGNDSLTGIQRGINNDRVNKISEFCQTEGAMFPGSILLSANYLNTGLLAEKDLWHIDGSEFIIPKKLEMASIVDGQHRVEGIKKAIKDNRLSQDFDIVCAIYFELPPAQQAELFATINFNQQKVDKSLAYQLFGYDLDSGNSDYWAPDTLAIYLTRLFDKEEGSVFKSHIGFGMAKSSSEDTVSPSKAITDSKDKNWLISTSTIVEGISGLISSNTTKDRYTLHKKRVFKAKRDILKENKTPAPLRNLYLEYEDGQLYDLISDYFLYIDKNIWSIPNLIFMRKTIGIQALFDILKLICTDITGKDQTPTSKAINQYLQNVDTDKLERLIVNYSGIGRLQIKNELKSQLSL